MEDGDEEGGLEDRKKRPGGLVCWRERKREGLIHSVTSGI